MSGYRWLPLMGVFALVLFVAAPSPAPAAGTPDAGALDEPQQKQKQGKVKPDKPGKPGGGDEDPPGDDDGNVIANVFDLYIRNTANVMGDKPVNGLTQYLDRRLDRLEADPCVEGAQQNTRGKNKRFGALVDLDRGPSEGSDGEDLSRDCNAKLLTGENGRLAERRTFTVTTDNVCVCLAMDPEYMSGSCSITPQVMIDNPALDPPEAGTDENPRVTASQLVGQDPETGTTLGFRWRVVRSDGASNYNLTADSVPFIATGGSPETFWFEGIRDFEFWIGGDAAASCPTAIPLDVDVTFVLHRDVSVSQ